MAAAILVLAPAAAGAAPAHAEGTGEASTSLLGADVTVTDVAGQSATGSLLDVVSEATTDGTPFSTASIVPVVLGDQSVGGATASSDGDTSASSPGGTLGDLTGLLGMSVQPVQLSATATEDTAKATVGVATGTLGGLLELVGLDLDTTGVLSEVTTTGATANQGLTVSGLGLGLGELGIDESVLANLDLATLLGLLQELGVEGLPSEADLETIVTLQSDLADALSGLGDLETDITDALAELGTLDALLGDLGDLGDLTDPTDVFNELTALQDTLASVGDGCDQTLPTLVDLLAGGDPLGTILGLVDSATTCVEEAATGLVSSLDADLATLVTLVGTGSGLVDDLLVALGGLEGLLDLLPDAAGTDLVGVGAFDVGMSAVAAETLEDSSATLGCAPVDVTILGQVTSTPDCSEGLSAVSDATAALSGAAGGITDLLNTLPLGEAVQASELRVEVLSDAVESVEEVDGVVTATAGLTLLELDLPQVTIDLSQATDTLADLLRELGLPAELADLQSLVETVTAEGALVFDNINTSALTDTVAGLTGQLDSTGALSTLVTELAGALDGLTLDLQQPITTPGLSLTVDPVSTASFEATAAPAPDEPAEDPAPTPSDEPEDLPSTGGGLALLAVLALGGAFVLGRGRTG